MDNMYDILNKMKLLEGKASKPDFLDLDRDGNKTEPMKKAAQDKKVEESMEEIEEVSYSVKAARAGKDIGKPGKQFAKIAKSAGERYGSKERGEKVAGAVLAKLRAKESVEEVDMDESALQAYLGKKKYGEAGMKALQQAGREGASKEKMARIRAQHDKMDEAEMDEGNDFTGARLAAIRAGKPTFSVGGKTYKVTGDTSDEKVMEKKEKTLWPGTPEYEKKFPKTMRTGEKKRSSTGGEIEKTATGIKHTAKAHDDEEETTAKDDGAPKKRGRPKGKDKGPERVTAKAWKHKGGRVKEGMEDEEMIAVVDKGEYDREGDMAREQLHTAADAAKELHDILDSDENLPEWVQSKITKAVDYLDTARDYMKATDSEDQEMAERKLTKPEMSKREKYVKSMKKSKGDFEKRYGERGEEVMYATATKMAKKKAKESKDKEEVEETTVAGSVATAPSPAKGKKGMVFGKGVYESKLEESYKSRLEKMLTEGMSINASQNEDGSKTLSVTATDDDATKLAQILHLAGMEQARGYEDACLTCGQSPCGCEGALEEADLANAPEPVYADTEMIKDQGEDLHKRKSTGQATLPTIYRGMDRQTSMAKVYEEVKAEAESKLWDLYKQYETK